MERILVVEDEAPLADAVARCVRRQGMAVDVAYDGLDGHGDHTGRRAQEDVVARPQAGVAGQRDVDQRLAADEAVGVLTVFADQAGDRAQLEALGLHLLDQAQAEAMVKHGGIGLADKLYAELKERGDAER